MGLHVICLIALLLLRGKRPAIPLALLLLRKASFPVTEPVATFLGYCRCINHPVHAGQAG